MRISKIEKKLNFLRTTLELMEQFTIQTSQNVGIEQVYASIGERIMAAIIDYAIMWAYFTLTIVLPGLLHKGAVIMILGLPVILYHLIFELTMNGQSPGKSIMKIKVISEDGTAPGFTNTFIRWVFRLIDITMTMGSVASIFIITGKKNQRLGDLTAGTILIRTRQKSTGRSFFTELPEDYTPVYPQVSMLQEKDIRVVKEVLDFLKSSKQNEESRFFAYNTRKRLEEKMGIKTNQKAFEFLDTVLMDYNYLNSR